MDERVQKYLKEKYGENYEKDSDAKLAESTSKNNIASAFSNLGDVFAGKAVGSGDEYFSGLNKQAKEKTVGKIENDKKSYMDEAIQGSQLNRAQREDSLSDPNSDASVSFRKSIESMNPGFAKAYGDKWGKVSAADKDFVFKPLELKQQMEDRALARQDRRMLAQDKNVEKQRKDAELSSTQAKQMGLFNIGKKAEEQYNKAVADKSKYDPTAAGQIIDNDTTGWVPNIMKNDQAIEAHAAQANWIESFLRDASGAAIPPNERQAYAADFFPQPGDTPAVVANKAMMRKEKMNNALIGAGPQGTMLAQESEKASREPDVEQYAQSNGISYEQALRVKQQRTSKQAGL